MDLTGNRYGKIILPYSFFFSNLYIFQSINFSGAIRFDFAVNLTEGGSHCVAISAATVSSIEQSPQIAASFIDYSGRFSISDLAVVFKKERGSSLQFGGCNTSCFGSNNRLGSWLSEYNKVADDSRTTCNGLQSFMLNRTLLLGFTQVCIYLATNGSSCGKPSFKGSSKNSRYYYTGQLGISGFSTTTRLNATSVQSPPCTVELNNASLQPPNPKDKKQEGKHHQ